MSGNNMKNINLVKKILLFKKYEINVGKNVKIKFVKDRPGHDFRYALDSRKIRRKLKWNQKSILKKDCMRQLIGI